MFNTVESPITFKFEVVILQEKISNVIKNFDGFEYYLYFTSGSNAYPKTTSTPPYGLSLWGSAPARVWYNNLLTSASEYDANNKDYLINVYKDTKQKSIQYPFSQSYFYNIKSVKEYLEKRMENNIFIENTDMIEFIRKHKNFCFLTPRT